MELIMNRKNNKHVLQNYKKNFALGVVSILIIFSLSLALFDESSSSNEKPVFLTLEGYEVIPLENLSLTEYDIESFFGTNDLLMFYLNEDGMVDYKLTQTINAGSTALETTDYGYKIWLDSDLCYLIAASGLGALSLVPGIGQIAAIILGISGIGAGIIGYIDSNFLHISNGICIEIKLFNSYKVIGYKIKLPTTPTIKNIYPQ